ncbi:MAG: hypothetical protein AAF734_11250, partial [Bacteroidota bacterium]
MKNFIKAANTVLSFSLLLLLYACGSDNDPDEEPTYSITNTGNGGVNEITDESDFIDLSVAQPIPSISGATYSTNIPIM